MTENIRVRFAPAPTGFLHLGSARTALFNWLFARHAALDGTPAEFVVRIEDTDVERSDEELAGGILSILTRLGLDWDGEPVRQSGRRDLHVAAVDQLLAVGAAYRCDCTQEAAKARAEARGRPGYDGHCRDRDVSAEVDHVVRFRTPDDGETSFDDLIRGTVTVAHSTLEDFVVRRTDGSPVFIIANAVDDADMGITHVIRGEDLINVTPKVLLVRDALGSTARPVFAHLPLIVNEQRKKLSKRRDDVSVGDFLDAGVLPAAMVNYLALLGWGPPDGIEVRPVDEIVELFEITHVNQAPAAFDVKKLYAVNAEHVRALSVDEFVAASMPYLEATPWFDRFDEKVFAALAPELQTRVKLMADVVELCDFVFLADPPDDEVSWNKAIAGNEHAPGLLDAAIERYEALGPDEFVASRLHEITLEIGESLGLKLGKAQAPIRVAVTGRTVGPPLFETLEVMGRTETLRRLREARTKV